MNHLIAAFRADGAKGFLFRAGLACIIFPLMLAWAFVLIALGLMTFSLLEAGGWWWLAIMPLGLVTAGWVWCGGQVGRLLDRL